MLRSCLSTPLRHLAGVRSPAAGSAVSSDGALAVVALDRARRRRELRVDDLPQAAPAARSADATWIGLQRVERLPRPCIGRRSVMSYSSPSGFAELADGEAGDRERAPCDRPRPAARRAARPSRYRCAGRGRCAGSRSGLSTSRVPGVAAISSSTCAGELAAACSRSGPTMRDRDRRVDRRAVLELLDDDARAGIVGELPRAARRSSCGLRARVVVLAAPRTLRRRSRSSRPGQDVVVDVRVAVAEVRRTTCLTLVVLARASCLDEAQRRDRSPRGSRRRRLDARRGTAGCRPSGTG